MTGETSQAKRPPEISVCLSGLPTYEAGAVLFTYLAFPEPGDDAEDQRATVHAALCHLALHAISQEHDSASWAPQILKPNYALMTESEVRTALRTFDRRLHDRAQAALMVKPFLEEAVTGASPSLPAGVKRLSLAAMAEWLTLRGKDEAAVWDRADTKNFLARVWRPSIPVLHIALGLNLLHERTHAAGIEKLAIHDLIRSPEAIAFILEQAIPLETLLPQIPHLGIPERELLRLRLT